MKMPDDRIYTLLIDIQKQLGENTRQTADVKASLDVFIAQQTSTNSKLNGLYQAHTELLKAMPEERRKEVFGEVNKLKHYFEGEIKPLKDDLQERQELKKKYKDGIFGIKMSILEKAMWVGLGFIAFNINHIIKFLIAYLAKIHHE